MQILPKSFIAASVAGPAEHRSLLHGLVAIQTMSRAAIAHTHHLVYRSVHQCSEEAIVTLLEARPGWRAASVALGGSFHPSVASRLVANGS